MVGPVRVRSGPVRVMKQHFPPQLLDKRWRCLNMVLVSTLPQPPKIPSLPVSVSSLVLVVPTPPDRPTGPVGRETTRPRKTSEERVEISQNRLDHVQQFEDRGATYVLLTFR